MSKRYILGVDLGSGAVKVTLLSRNGEIAGISTVEYPTHYPKTGWAEQEPEEWYAAFREGIRLLFQNCSVDPREIGALAIDSATHTSVLMDENCNVLRPAIFWTDQRCIAQSEELNRLHGDTLYRITHHYSNPVWTLPQLLWVRENEPGIWARTRKIFFAKDYLRYRMTGIYATDEIDAMGTLFYDSNEMKWSGEICEILGFPVDDLPKTLEPTHIIGNITSEASRETGLAEETKVIVGTTDTALELFAAGAVNEGQATVKLATAGRICIVTDNALPHPYLINYRHVIPGKWYPGTATKACAASLRWYKDTLGDYERHLADQGNGSVYKILDEGAGKVGVGAEGLFFHPYLMGELTPYFDPLLRGSFTGLTMKHTKNHFTRAVLEGVGFSLKDCMGVMDELKVEMENVRIIGGGSESPLWRQIIADILGVEVIKMERDDSSLGSAMLAGVGMGYFSSFQDAVERCTRIQSVTKPDPGNNKRYAEMYALYKEIQQSMEEVNHKISTYHM